MVSLKTPESTHIRIIKDWRDYKEYIFVLGTFIIGLIIGIIVMKLTQNTYSTALIVLLIMIIILLAFYLFPHSITDFWIEDNVWINQKKVFGITIKRKFGKISSIKMFVSLDKITTSQKSRFLPFNTLSYHSSLQLWGSEINQEENTNKDTNQMRKSGKREKEKKKIEKKEKERKIEKKNDKDKNKIALFERTNYSQREHLREVQNNNQIAQALSEYFDMIGLPIGYEFIKKQEHKP